MGLDVLLVAGAGDGHASAIESALDELGARTARLNLTDLGQSKLSLRLGNALEIEVAGRHEVVDANTTVWWRRPGWLDTTGMGPAEAQLAESEAWVLFTGVVTVCGAHLVDPPSVIHLAEDKIGQLTAARSLGIHVPDTLVTNSPEAASAFLRGGPVVAKAASSGSGLAPFADAVGEDDLELVQMVPVLLQREVAARADLRVVTIGETAYGWRRPRTKGGPVDWRRTDPAGASFGPLASVPAAVQAPELAQRLGLTFSVQDWLETDSGGSVFLEVNPQGQWLFLAGAAELVVPALAHHLLVR